MGKMSRPWQDTEYVLGLFGKSLKEARRHLEKYVTQWALKGRCSELTGGGLIRSSGGWRAIKEAFRDGTRLVSDERILGGSEFVEETLKQAGEAYDRKTGLQWAGVDLSGLITSVCRHFGIEHKELLSNTKHHKVAQARAVISHIATRDFSFSGSEVARRLQVDRSAVSRAVRRVGNDPDLLETARLIRGALGLPEPEIRQH
ncbi:MAG: REP-associated tyrosine transposase [Thermodesulfobacteriota bacterium]|nr:REP-associated tyrosine transposase [Thermodesulfobacteriota bacterium]